MCSAHSECASSRWSRLAVWTTIPLLSLINLRRFPLNGYDADHRFWVPVYAIDRPAGTRIAGVLRNPALECRPGTVISASPARLDIVGRTKFGFRKRCTPDPTCHNRITAAHFGHLLRHAGADPCPGRTGGRERY